MPTPDDLPVSPLPPGREPVPDLERTLDLLLAAEVTVQRAAVNLLDHLTDLAMDQGTAATIKHHAEKVAALCDLLAWCCTKFNPDVR